MTYYYDGHELTAKTDDAARRQARELIREGKARAGCNMEFYRQSDGCHGWYFWGDFTDYGDVGLISD